MNPGPGTPHPGYPRLVPLTVLATAPLSPETIATLAETCAVRLGATHEIDLVRAEKAAPGSAQVLAAYLTECRALWSRPLSVESRRTRRELLRARQKDTAAGRVDLTDAVDAIAGHPATTQAALLLDRQPPWKELGRLGELQRTGDRAQLTVDLPAGNYPLSLGGPATLGEVGRTLTLHASHATWRDRRVRRLIEIIVEVDERWPAVQGQAQEQT